MRHYAAELQAAGYRVLYQRLTEADHQSSPQQTYDAALIAVIQNFDVHSVSCF